MARSAAAKLAVEVDSQTHLDAERSEHDQRQTSWLVTKGIRVVRIAATDVRDHFDGVINDGILEYVPWTLSIWDVARKTRRWAAPSASPIRVAPPTVPNRPPKTRPLNSDPKPANRVRMPTMATAAGTIHHHPKIGPAIMAQLLPVTRTLCMGCAVNGFTGHGALRR